MPRIRTIKPEFPQSESMGRVSRDARLLFIELWTLCDDSGRTRASSRMLASLLFPYDDDAPAKMDDWLDELDREDCIRLYRSGGNTYLQICNWLNHQKIDKPSQSKVPEFDESSRIFAKPRERSSLDQGPRTKEGIKERTKDQGPVVAKEASRTPTAGSVAWNAYSDAYLSRYSQAPVRNSKTNALMKQLVDRLGADESPKVAAFYVSHNSQFYVSRGHAVEHLVKDAEKLRTEWATGRTVTATIARQTDQSDSNPFLRMLQNGEGNAKAP